MSQGLNLTCKQHVTTQTSHREDLLRSRKGDTGVKTLSELFLFACYAAIIAVSDRGKKIAV